MIEVATALISAAVGAAGSLGAAYIQMRRHKQEARVAKEDLRGTEKVLRVAQENLKGITLPVIVEAEFKRVSIMLLGVGGSGKTTFIRSLFDAENANPDVKTETYDLYHHESRAGMTEGGLGDARTDKGIKMFIGDYKGQDVGTLIRTFVLQQKEPYHPMAYGYVNSLVMLVDLVPPPADEDGPEPEPRKEADRKRISYHNRQWNETALDAMFGLLTSKSLKYVCLFINKYDLIEAQGPGTEEQVKQGYRPLIRRLSQRAKGAGAEFGVIIGSARTGEGLALLRSKLYRIDSAIG